MCTGIPCSAANSSAAASSPRGSEGESAITASIRSPSISCASYARNAESVPPEYATISESSPPSALRSCIEFLL